ncbi:DUF4046 domain-containing protein [Brevibacillus sp. NPDC003359]|uniref:DUF4046 domain-containing protein n=1 Tax=unclassified Brevibacillus TaxID=2684853 RepID=UPI00367889C2
MSIIDIYEKVLAGKLKRFPKYTWDVDYGGLDNIKICMRYLILDKMKWDRDDLLEKISAEFVHNCKLAGGLVHVFNTNTPFLALAHSFPEWDLKRWEFKHITFNKWTEEDKKDALGWLIEEKLKWSYEEIIENLSVRTFQDWGLDSLLSNFFKNSPVRAMKYLYPESDWTLLEQEFKERKRRNAKEVGTNTKGRISEKAMLTDEQVRLIRKTRFDRKNNITFVSLGKELNIHRSAIRDAYLRKNYKHVSDE